MKLDRVLSGDRREASGSAALPWILVGDGVSNFGSQLALVAVPTYAVRYLDADPSGVGLIYTLQWIAPLVIGLVAGQIADRRSQPNVMLCADAVAFATLALLAYLMWLRAAPLWTVCVLTTLGTAAGTFYSMGSAALIPRLLSPTARGGGNAKLEAVRSLSEVGALALAARLIEIAAGSLVMLINAITRLLRFTAILRTRSITARDDSLAPRQASRWSPGRDMLLLHRLFVRHKLLRALLGAHATASLGGAVILTFFYDYAYKSLGLTPADVALMLAAGSAAGLIGALGYAWVAERLGSDRLLRSSLGVWVCALWAIPFAPKAWALTVLVGYQILFSMASTLFAIGLITRQQNATPKRYQGRIASISLMLGYGAMALGGAVTLFAGGFLSTRQGIILGCLLSSATWLWFFQRERSLGSNGS